MPLEGIVDPVAFPALPPDLVDFLDPLPCRLGVAGYRKLREPLSRDESLRSPDDRHQFRYGMPVDGDPQTLPVLNTTQ